MIKIAIIGYGKMGKEIESTAQDFNYQIVSIIDQNNNLIDEIKKHKPDVAIEFTNANAVVNNIKTCVDLHLPVVSGTTGWDNEIEEIKKYTLQNNGNVLWGSNFNLGVNLWFDFVDYISEKMKTYEDYKVRLEEIHHIHKLDKPSGTAIQAAQIVMKHYNFKNWSLDDKKDYLNITSIRQGEEVGTHSVIFTSLFDQITIEHKNFSRKALAIGALTAAKWIINHPGFYIFHDVYQ
ncbi:MAG TPA: 4-hydroxy-tetrahydrodipicolinate reductase, partial [Bacteroidales bacterium]|nr:4-hydroxy-tetrahydrodipicolinate reductase [Bacteroidales bacterium]